MTTELKPCPFKQKRRMMQLMMDDFVECCEFDDKEMSIVQNIYEAIAAYGNTRPTEQPKPMRSAEEIAKKIAYQITSPNFTVGNPNYLGEAIDIIYTALQDALASRPATDRDGVWNEAMEIAANLATGYPCVKHGHLSLNPHTVLSEASLEIGSAIRALKRPAEKEGK